MNKINYQRELEKIIDKNIKENRIPTLLLHSCCAPCSSYCLEYLSEYFVITDLYYNPNITDEAEYRHREEELSRLISEQPHLHPVTFIAGNYEPEKFREIARGLEMCPEGGARCEKCYELRIREAAEYARRGGFDEIGFKVAGETGTVWLPSDFKKKGGFQRSTELSSEYGLYRQNYCGCVFSKRDAQANN